MVFLQAAEAVRSTNVNYDETLKVGNDRTDKIGNDESVTIGNNRTEKVGNDEQDH